MSRASDARVSQGVTLPIGEGEPIAGVAIGIRGDQPATVNAMRVVRGHAPEVGRSDQVVLLEAFAHARNIHLGDEVAVVILGRMKRLRVVGVGVSAEYLFTMPPGEMMPDVARFAVLWLDETALSVAADMEGSVNRFSARVQPGASAARIAKEFDRVLHDYGGLGAVTRARQQSNFILEGELMGLRNMSFAMPMIFLAVAALLLNLIMKRIVREHRGQIATLAAVGYSSTEIAWSYGRIALLVGAAGATTGVALGWVLGLGLIDIYREFFALPGLVFALRPGAAVGALVASCLAALIGAMGALRSVLALAPAEAMRPPAPQKYGRGAFASFSLLSPMVRMTLRELARKPLRTFGTVTAVASAVALLVMARWFDDAMTLLIDTQFRSALRDDVTVNLHEPVPVNQLRMFEHLPGVIRAEGLRGSRRFAYAKATSVATWRFLATTRAVDCAASWASTATSQTSRRTASC